MLFYTNKFALFVHSPTLSIQPHDRTSFQVIEPVIYYLHVYKYKKLFLSDSLEKTLSQALLRISESYKWLRFGNESRALYAYLNYD